MKKTLYTIFTGLIFVILIGRMLGWVLHFSEAVNNVLNIVMFSLIGITYIVMAVVWDNRLVKILMFICGVFMIAINFFESNSTLNIIGIACMLTPMLIARFSNEKDSKATI